MTAEPVRDSVCANRHFGVERFVVREARALAQLGNDVYLHGLVVVRGPMRGVGSASTRVRPCVQLPRLCAAPEPDRALDIAAVDLQCGIARCVRRWRGYWCGHWCRCRWEGARDLLVDRAQASFCFGLQT